ncbi:uncharacterized protein CCOS01_01314 [Colletotrichum costaricense]|uniref:Uncharacterized protein n=1 Tax=Colletotrichum costaricense TaxID=1209916 RepID=A0AAJ0E6V9_9PEZI|nr:uncharacterized protein CCOS01_01314 [Colletotrichum costaricense]KAK1540000.1 hypothetical protein CCOS01_01314 [Colletotrichum costaricense]
MAGCSCFDPRAGKEEKMGKRPADHSTPCGESKPTLNDEGEDSQNASPVIFSELVLGDETNVSMTSEQACQAPVAASTEYGAPAVLGKQSSGFLVVPGTCQQRISSSRHWKPDQEARNGQAANAGGTCQRQRGSECCARAPTPAGSPQAYFPRAVTEST